MSSLRQTLMPLAEAGLHKLIGVSAAASAKYRDTIVAELTQMYDDVASDVHLGTLEDFVKPAIRAQIPTLVDAGIKYLSAQAAAPIAPAATTPVVSAPVTTSPATTENSAAPSAKVGFGF